MFQALKNLQQLQGVVDWDGRWRDSGVGRGVCYTKMNKMGFLLVFVRGHRFSSVPQSLSSQGYIQRVRENQEWIESDQESWKWVRLARQRKVREAFWAKSTTAGAKVQSGNKMYGAMAEVEWEWITRSLTFLNCKVWSGVCQERRLERELGSMLLRTWKAMPGSLAIIISKGCHQGVIFKGGITQIAF